MLANVDSKSRSRYIYALTWHWRIKAQMHTIKSKTSTISLTIAGFLLFAYTATRAGCLSITFDEAFMYLEFIRKGAIFPTQFNIMSANNHLLNTWLSILFVQWFGAHDLVVRLPALLGHLLFLWYSAKLVGSLQNSRLTPAAFLILNTNPYLLDYFSLARGYGLSFGLMMASIYYLYIFQTKERAGRSAALSIAFAISSALANLVQVNYCLLLYALIVLQMFRQAQRTGRWLDTVKVSGIPTVLMAVFLPVVIPYLIHLKNAGALFFGGESGFWIDTVNATINSCFYDIWHNAWFRRGVKAGMLLTMVCAIASVGAMYTKRRIDPNLLFPASLLALTGLIALSTVLQHYLFGTLFLTNRTAMFFCILFTVLFVFFIAGITNRSAVLILYAVAALSLAHLACAFNLSYVVDWKFDSDGKEIVADLIQIRATNPAKNDIRLGTFFCLSPSIEYYALTNKVNWLKSEITLVQEIAASNSDYFYISHAALSLINLKLIDIIKVYPATKSVLAKNCRPETRSGDTQ
jgi:hypothetical protein